MIKRTVTKLSYIVIYIVFALSPIASHTLGKDIDTQVREIASLLMCPVCQGQVVAESNSELAKNMRAIIRKQLEEGKSKEEIIAYFVERYGDSILGAPPPKGINWVLWLFPALALTAGTVIASFFLYRSRKESKDAETDITEDNPTAVEIEYIKKIEKELKEFDS
ncbi:Cytochrome c-type biogenesis protein CcmH [bacterium HR37]|nr:Cytochrome c-type biogenesis protein CcmH [bacterium HR37]